LSDKADPEELLQKIKDAENAAAAEEKQEVSDDKVDQSESTEIDSEEKDGVQ
jgi:hypothetical protein